MSIAAGIDADGDAAAPSGDAAPEGAALPDGCGASAAVQRTNAAAIVATRTPDCMPTFPLWIRPVVLSIRAATPRSYVRLFQETGWRTNGRSRSRTGNVPLGPKVLSIP